MSGEQAAAVPFGSFGFKVIIKIDGEDKDLGCFQEVSGLSVTINVEDVAEGGVNNTTHKIITGASYSNIVLKRGLCDAGMFGWIKKVLDNQLPNRVDGTITILGDDRQPVKNYKFKRGIPVTWDGPSLNVTSDAIATETLEIAHEGLTVG